MPRLLAIHLGVSLLAAAATGHFLTHDLDVDDLTGGSALLLTGPVGLLSAMDLLGVAVFLSFVPPFDAAFGRVDPDPATLRKALFALRLGAGGALITLAFAVAVAGATELLFGLLVISGALPQAAAYGSNPTTAQLVRWLPPLRGRTPARTPAVATCQQHHHRPT